MKKIVITGLLITTTLFGSTTGKLTGFVRDANTGESLIGCNILIVGTDLGAATDINGQYFILNVPPGRYDVKSIMIGFTSVISQSVQINVDLTSTIDFELNIEVLGGQEVTVVAQRSMVKMDLTSSEARISSDQLEVMPVNEIWDVLSILGGVTKDAGGGIHIRGGRGREVAYWVDGVSVTDSYDGGLSVAVDNNSIQELQVISGTFNAEYGQSMSGIINLVTKDGSSDYHGHLSTYQSGYYTNDTKITGLENFDITNEQDLIASLSGPAPLFSNRLKFYTHARYNKSNGWLNAYRIFDKNGDFEQDLDDLLSWYLENNKSHEPDIYHMNTREKFNTNTKLTFNVLSGMKLRFSLMTSDETYQDYRHEAQWSPEGELWRFNSGRNYKLSLTHSLSSRTFYNVDLTQFSKSYQHYAYESISDSNYIDPYFWSHAEYGTIPKNSFKIWGVDKARFERKTTTNVVKFDITSQFTPIHQIKFGAEYRKHNLFLDDFSIQDADLSDTVYTIKIPGDHLIEYSDASLWSVSNLFNNGLIQAKFKSKSDATEFSDFYNRYVEYNRRTYDENPDEFSIYVQDKIEFQSVIINIGLRYDWFNSNGVVPTNPAEPYLGNPRNPFIDTLTYQERDNIDWTDYAQYYKTFLPDSGVSLIGTTGWWNNVKSSQKISPRLGIAYPITDKGVIHFSFGHFFQIPSFERLFSNPGYKIPEESGKFGVYGNPDLKPQKTVSYELGLKQELFPRFSIDVTGYYRDVRDWVSTGIPIDLGGGASYYIYVNKDYSNVRGVTLNIDRQFYNNYGFNFNYTYQIAEGSNSNPDEEFGALSNNDEPTRAILPLEWDQRHTINGSLFLGGKAWNLSILGQFGSGYPYTPSINIASLTGINTSTVLKTNSRRKPITYNFDANFIYTLPFRQIDSQLYIKILNILDRRNENTVYGDSGRADQTLDNRPEEDENRVNSVDDFYNRPDWFSAPRQIQIGLKFSF